MQIEQLTPYEVEQLEILSEIQGFMPYEYFLYVEDGDVIAVHPRIPEDYNLSRTCLS